MLRVAFGIVLALLVGQDSSAQESLGFDLVEIDATHSGQNPGFVFHAVGTYLAEHGGAAAVDFDEDGDVDLFYPDTEGHPNALWVNDGSGRFVDLAAERGVAQPEKRRGLALFFDLEEDGDLDLVTVGYPDDTGDSDLFTLFRNDGAPTWSFTDVTASAGGFVLAPTMESTTRGDPGGICAGDVDGNGSVDLFCTWWARVIGLPVDQPRLFRNTTNPSPPAPGQSDHSPRVLSDATLEAGLDVPFMGNIVDAWLWMPSLVDLDRDGDLDLRINLERAADVLFLNDGSGRFTSEVAEAVGYAGHGHPPAERSEMGVAFGDPDNDGDLDSYHTNNNLEDVYYRNDSELGSGGGGLRFTEVAEANGFDACINIGWGAVFADMDADGDEDLLNVRGLAVGTRNYFFRNEFPELTVDGGTVRFVDESDALPEYAKLGPHANQKDIARGLLTFDHDLDGDLDVIVTRQGDHPLAPTLPVLSAGVFENVSWHGHRWLEVDLRERYGSRNVIGARIHVKAGGVVQMREVLAGSSFLNQLPYRQHFGFGREVPSWCAVRWFDGGVSVATSVTPDTLLRVERGAVDATGDLDGDGRVTLADLYVFVAYAKRPEAVASALSGWSVEILADVNGDGVVDPLDRALLESLLGFDELEAALQPGP